MCDNSVIGVYKFLAKNREKYFKKISSKSNMELKYIIDVLQRRKTYKRLYAIFFSKVRDSTYPYRSNKFVTDTSTKP